MIRFSRMATTAVTLIALAAGTPGLAHAQPSAEPRSSPQGHRSAKALPGDDGRLPEGWRLTGTGAGRQLVWTSAERVPMGDARVEFHDGDRLLGRPVPGKDGRSFRLTLDGADIGTGKGLKVVAGGRRLDEGGTARTPEDRRPAAPVPPAAALPANPVDPGLPGGHRTITGEYDLAPVRLPGFPAPVELRGVVVAPVDAPGPRPVALFLHGRHYTCFDDAGNTAGEWPCPSGLRPVPSHRGYLHDQRLLASQGYVTVSISANGINGQDYLADDGGAQARSSLIRLHLARWAQWAADRDGAPAAVRKAARPDLSRVLLVGHSRGGEGVNRAALDSLSRPPAAEDGYHGPVRWTIRGTVLTGPTIFGHNPAPDVPSMTILPGCDGDVSDLQGQIYADGTRGVSRGAALHSAVYMVGANHNFFNSEWTPGQAQAPADDDFWSDESPDPVCSPGTRTRLTATQQQTAGSTYIAAAARLFVAGDDRVRPLLDGSDRRAPSAGPARVLTHAVGAHRTAAFLPDTSPAVTGGRLCNQVDRNPATVCLSTDDVTKSPHFTTWAMSPEQGRHAVAMTWSRAGAATRVTPARPVSLTGARALALRVIVPPNTTGTQLDIAVTDTKGRRAHLGRARVDGLPGTGRTTSYWAREIRVPLSAAVRAGLNLKKVRSLELTPRTTSGRAWLMDAWGWRPGTPAARPAALPRIDIGGLTVKEGDSGVRTYRVPVRISGKGGAQVRLFLSDPVTGEFRPRLVTLRPGAHTIDLPVTVRGNTRYSEVLAHYVLVKSVRGALIGSYQGGVMVENDDPKPTAVVTPVAETVTEGQPLTWRVTLSAIADSPITAFGFTIRPVTGSALSTADVDAQWLEDIFGESAVPERPLWQLDNPEMWAYIPAGRPGVEVTVPTVGDFVSEPEESLRLEAFEYDDGIGAPPPGEVFTGRVRDAS
ncbi:alpha/beta hydrolase family protein [Streptomyces sp. NPDC051018]|uniref:alpha/beta hydrolase family protein n=1 Tax=Streptomyces sp. NPDC051018 TaxID=3365639 RepID=UPI00379EEE81